MHVRNYVTEIVDVQLKRTQRSERLYTTDNEHHSVTCTLSNNSRFRFFPVTREQSCDLKSPRKTRHPNVKS